MEPRIIIAAETGPQMDAVRDFLNTLDEAGRHSLLDFFQGAKFMQHLMSAASPMAEQDSA